MSAREAGIRVLHVIKSLGRGGAEMLLLTTHGPLARLGVSAEYAYFLPWKDAMVEELRAAGAPVHLVEARSSVGVVFGARRLRRLVNAGRYDLIHCHLPLAGVAGRIAGWRAGVPVVYTEHNLQERYRWPTRVLNGRTWGCQRQVIAVSGDVERSIRDNLGDRVPVRTVSNGVDTDHYAPDPARRSRGRDALGLAPETPVVGTVAVFRTQKRLDRWLEAGQLIARAHPDVRFLIVGDGPERQNVERKAREAGLEGRLILPGLAEDVRELVSAMDIFMISSDFEGLPVALLEAMALGVAVVSTGVGGIPEAIDSGHSGIVVDEKTSGALAAACNDLLADAAARERLSVSARRAVIDRFSIDRMASELAAIYRQVARSAAARGPS